MHNRRLVQLGKSQVDLAEMAGDVRGFEDRIAEVIEEDWPESRHLQFGTKMHVFAEAADIAEWDQVVLGRYEPLYTDPQGTCGDCLRGPCHLENQTGKCGLNLDAYQGKLTLKMACKGCLVQMASSRELLDYAIKESGRHQPVTYGDLSFLGDLAPSIGLLTGIFVKDLDDLNTVLSYAEGQLIKLIIQSYSGTASGTEFEGMAFHAGSVLALAMEVVELIKTSCFGFATGAMQKPEDLPDYPPVNVLGGLGNVDRQKPVIVFVGDNFLPAWTTINYLRDNGLEDSMEICGIGAAGDDTIRFYDRCRIVAPTMKAGKVIRSGFADVIVANESCLNLDILGEARRVNSRVIWTGREAAEGLPDRTDDPIEEIVKDLVAGHDGAWIRDVTKAGAVAVRTAQSVNRDREYPLSDEAVMEQAQRCSADCDLCFAACPDSLMIGRAVRGTVEKGIASLYDVAKECHFCGKCEEACPTQLPLLGMVATAEAKREAEDKFVMRAGRGSITQVEGRQGALPLLWGNFPGYPIILGCGGTGVEDIGFIAHELLSLNCPLIVAGCAAGEVAHHFNPAEGKFIAQEFTTELPNRGFLNCGGCSAIVHILDFTHKVSKIAGAISQYANYVEVADYNCGHCQFVFIIWGGQVERMHLVATTVARNGYPVILGPASGFLANRYLLGNKYDRARQWAYDGVEGTKREIEPVPGHLIIPVETKEEALVMAGRLFYRWADTRELRAVQNEAYIEAHQKYFADMPDDWQLFVRSDAELPVRYKARLLRELREKHGWEIEGLRIKKAKHRDGRLLPLDEFVNNYGAGQGGYCTWISRLVTKAAREKNRQV